MMTYFRIGLAQININFANPTANLHKAADLIAQAHTSKCSLVLFPELWTTGYDLENGNRWIENNNEIIGELQKLSTELNIWVGGTFIVEAGGSLYNQFVMVSPDPQIRYKYSKTHLFGLMGERQWFTPGEELAIFPAPMGPAGLTICYDLRFPELYRNLTLRGAICMCLAAEWPSKRQDHWNTLIRARSIENQVFMFAVNSVGKTGSETFGGGSLIVDPWGSTVASGSSTDEELVIGNVDFDEVDRVRSKLPALDDRRVDLY